MSKLYQFCTKNEKETVQKLKESTANALVHLRGKSSGSSSHSDKDSDEGYSDDQTDNNRSPSLEALRRMPNLGVHKMS